MMPLVGGNDSHMWKFIQASGQLFFNDVEVWLGYSGAGGGKNAPDRQHVRNQGPIPRGWWTIGEATDDGPTALSLPLIPDPGTKLFGRFGFYIHGENARRPGASSRGCIIVDHDVRVSLRDSTDRRLLVIARTFRRRSARR